MKIFKKKTDRIRAYLDNHPVNYELDEKEVKCLYALNLVEKKYNISFKTFIEDHVCRTCLFKIEDEWVVWDTDGFGCYYNMDKFSNVYDACIATMDKYFINIIRRKEKLLGLDDIQRIVETLLYEWSVMIDMFDSLCIKEYDQEVLNAYANINSFKMIPNNEEELQKTRK